MPGDVWTTAQVTKPSSRIENTVYSLTRPITEADLARMLHYSVHIRRIMENDLACFMFPRHAQLLDIDESVYEAFRAFDCLRGVLANLQVLRMAVFPSTVPYLRDYFGPNLREVSIIAQWDLQTPYGDVGHEADQTGFAKMVADLHQASPLLERLETAMAWHPATAEATSKAVCSFQHLRTFLGEYYPLSPDAFRHLASLPALDTLNVNLTPSDYPDVVVAAIMDIPPESRFPAVRTLTVTSEDLGTCAMVLRAICSTSLWYVKVEGEGASSVPLIHDVFSALGEHPSRAHIQYLILDQHEHDAPQDALHDAIDDAAFEPILQVSNLRRFSVAIQFLYHITDRLLARMASTWHELRRLELGSEALRGLDRTPRATLAGIAALALGCPHLSFLELEFDTSKAGPPRGVPPIVNAAHPLSFLEIGYSKITEPAPVATYLSQLFPDLDDIQADWPMEEDFEDGQGPLTAEDEASINQREGWDEVSALLTGFSCVRRQERNWAAEHGQNLSLSRPTIEEYVAALDWMPR